MNRLMAGTVAAAAALGLAGCESLITGGDLVREGLPTVRFIFQNTSSQPIDTILISTCEASSYGLDRLPEGVVVRQGQSYEWTISAGCYDVMAGAVGVGSTSGQRIRVPAGRTFVLTYDGQNR
ncbi:MAG: hypothetical protein KJ676_14480 [Alphaproteobacteria bacterium]|nr:hypothetical protein [Alphaproteobacteria bacterium]MBU1526760.1 hypothetical protein [Alphaproteobacteria bacterium]MBU2117288.1 hypothetical protein [Alphaproteobacteria bacterium]MBU2350111.1 hypothetical protein [Alphaproteobacteria bacterium]MBU2383070.1 hypothetical protein [Alphaproteobacteria bacterium]